LGDLETCLLPRPKAKIFRTSKSLDQADVRNGGGKLFYIRGTFVGKINYLSSFSSDSADTKKDIVVQAREIFESRLKNYQKAPKTAQIHA
jgi:hypothetical protein